MIKNIDKKIKEVLDIMEDLPADFKTDLAVVRLRQAWQQRNRKELNQKVQERVFAVLDKEFENGSD